MRAAAFCVPQRRLPAQRLRHGLREFSGRQAAYDGSSAYYGLHAGPGHVRNIADNASLAGRRRPDPVRRRAPAPRGRLSRIVNEHLRPCIGAAWEHEFDGRAHAAASGFAIDSPNLKAIPA